MATAHSKNFRTTFLDQYIYIVYKIQCENIRHFSLWTFFLL